MPLLRDGDVVQGWIRERILIRRIYEATVSSRSEILRSYVQGICKATGLPASTVSRSQPVKNFLKKLAG